MLKINLKQLQEIRYYAKQSYPEECCGLLLGTISQEQKTVLKIWHTKNSWQAEDWQEWDNSAKERNKQSRYSIAPQEILAAQKWAREQQSELAIIGVYHSHCDHPAIPSEFDRAIAWLDYSYIIIAVRQGVAAEIQSWILNQKHQFVAEIVEQK